MKVDGANPAPNTHSFARVPRTMRAVLLREFGGPELLRMEEVPAPNPATLDDDEVLIQVRACGICYHDIINRRGDLPRTRVPLILGHEIAGSPVFSALIATLAIYARTIVPPFAKTDRSLANRSLAATLNMPSCLHTHSQEFQARFRTPKRPSAHARSAPLSMSLSVVALKKKTPS